MSRSVLFFLSFASLAAVPPDDWPAAARKGDTNRVEALLIGLPVPSPGQALGIALKNLAIKQSIMHYLMVKSATIPKLGS